MWTFHRRNQILLTHTRCKFGKIECFIVGIDTSHCTESARAHFCESKINFCCKNYLRQSPHSVPKNKRTNGEKNLSKQSRLQHSKLIISSQQIWACEQCYQMVRLFFNVQPFAAVRNSPIMSQICQSRLSILPNKK